MKKSEIQAGVNKHYRIEPPLQHYSDEGKLLQAVDDVWIVHSATDTEVTLGNRATAHRITLGYDSFVSFQQDPDGKVHHQAEGVLVLKVQLYMFRGELLFRTTVAPGRPAPEAPPPVRRKSPLETIRANKAAFDLRQKRRAFAWSTAGVAAAQRAFDEIGAAVHLIATEEVGLTEGADYVLRRFGSRYLLGIAGWWVTIAWEPMASNTLESAFLNIRKWSSHPPWPDVHVTRHAHELAIEQYVFGLIDAEQAGWMTNWSGRPFSAREIVEKIINELMASPNLDPGIAFE